MPESFGARLRQRREERHVTLNTIAEKTKITLSLLEGLERDDVSHWPSGIFRRAYIRAYAHAIGFDADDVIREFQEVHPDPTDVVESTFTALGATDARPSAGPPTRLRYIVESAIESLSLLRRTAASRDPASTPGVPAHVTMSDDARAAAASRPRVPGPAGRTAGVIADREPMNVPAASDPDILAVARLCTEFSRVGTIDEMRRLLRKAARILDATGLIVWLWDATAAQLRPVLAHGYPDWILARWPAVGRDADNATAAAFRSARTCATPGNQDASGGLVVPLLTPTGCAGVLAVEVPNGREQVPSVRAVATIFAALVAQLIGPPHASDQQVSAAESLQPGSEVQFTSAT